MAAQIQFDGSDVIVSLTDTVTSGNVITSFVVNPAGATVFGGKPAYVGFTGATGAFTATQEIDTWTFTQGGPPLPGAFPPEITFPVVTTPSGPSTQVEIFSPGATVFYNTTGKPLGLNSPVFPGGYAAPAPVPGTTYYAVAFLKGPFAPNGVFSPVVSATYGTATGTPPDTTGFTSKTLALNGSAAFVGNRLRLTNTKGSFEAGSAWSPILGEGGPAFSTSFDFQISDAAADGFMFVLQNSGDKALGSPGGGLGYAGLDAKSFGIKFDLFDNAGEGINSTGLYTGGVYPTTPAIDLTPSGIDLHSGHIFHVTVSDNEVAYLYVEITDTLTGATAHQSYPSTAFTLPVNAGVKLGFTGATGGLTATQDILAWDYQSAFTQFPVPFPPPISPAPGTYTTPVTVTFNPGTNPRVTEDVYYTLDGSTPTRRSLKYVVGQSIGISKTTTITYIGAVGPTTDNPLSNISNVSTATYTIKP